MRLLVALWFMLTLADIATGQSKKNTGQSKKDNSAPPRPSLSQTPRPYVSHVWVADQGDGTYKNPVLNADYSDPDVIRVGNDYYLVSSSFEDMPGLPVLHSKDLVNWQIIGYGLQRQPPYDHFDEPRHGDGVWAPSIRYYHNEFYIYYPDPDYGIYLIKAKDPAGPWSEPIIVYPGKGLIDPCALIDEDGQMYLVHAYAGSRAGIKSILAVNKLNKEGTKVTDAGILVYDGHEKDPTIEGPKFYKRNGYYYIFAPAGGVATGWQLVLRSKNIYGPYERRVVMDQGTSPTNGPHQGAWVNTQTGEDWFLHFQDRGPYGRVTHLEPMQWKDNWPVIGIDPDSDGKGQPVLTYKKPNIGRLLSPRTSASPAQAPVSSIQTPFESDEFNGNTLGLQWQWMANPQATWYFMSPATGKLRLFSMLAPSARSLWECPNVLLQKFPAGEFVITTKLRFTPNPKLEGEKVGLAIMGLSYADIAVRSGTDGTWLVYGVCKDADKGNAEEEQKLIKLETPEVYLRVKVADGGICSFSYSLNGVDFITVGDPFQARPGRWIGAKAGIFCVRDRQTNDAGYADFDWFRVTGK